MEWKVLHALSQSSSPPRCGAQAQVTSRPGEISQVKPNQKSNLSDDSHLVRLIGTLIVGWCDQQWSLDSYANAMGLCHTYDWIRHTNGFYNSDEIEAMVSHRSDAGCVDSNPHISRSKSRSLHMWSRLCFAGGRDAFKPELGQGENIDEGRERRISPQLCLSPNSADECSSTSSNDLRWLK